MQLLLCCIELLAKKNYGNIITHTNIDQNNYHEKSISNFYSIHHINI